MTKALENNSITGIIRWMGFNGFEKAEALAALEAHGVTPNGSTLNTQLYHGRRTASGTPSGGAIIELNKDEAAALLKFKAGAAPKPTKKASAKKAATKGKATKKKTTKRKGV